MQEMRTKSLPGPNVSITPWQAAAKPAAASPALPGNSAVVLSHQTELVSGINVTRDLQSSVPREAWYNVLKTKA